MGEFFGSMYCFPFEDFFGLELAQYLWGLSAKDVTTNQFIGIGLWMSGISFAIAVLFYYIVNHPRLCNWWGWGIFLVGNAAINYFIGWQWVDKDRLAGLMVYEDPVTKQLVDLPITSTDCICFGVSNMILSIVAFFIISCIIKWWSTNVASAPFVK